MKFEQPTSYCCQVIASLPSHYKRWGKIFKVAPNPDQDPDLSDFIIVSQDIYTDHFNTTFNKIFIETLKISAKNFIFPFNPMLNFNPLSDPEERPYG